MAKKTYCNGLDWSTMLGLLHQLKKDKKYREYLLIGTGSFLGLRAKDLLALKWSEIYEKDEIVIKERKTGKTRNININQQLQEILKNTVSELSKSNNFCLADYLFKNKFGNAISIQYANRILHKTFNEYNIKVQNSSTHTLRKTFAKRVWEKDLKSERSLIYLSQIFNH